MDSLNETLRGSYKSLAKSPTIIHNYLNNLSLKKIILFVAFIVLIIIFVFIGINNNNNDDIEEFDTCSSCS